MKRFRYLLVFACLALIQPARAGAVKLETDDQKASYGMAVEMMQSLQNDDLSLDNRAFLQGLRDVQTGRGSRLSADEARKAKDYLIVKQINQHKQKLAETLVTGRTFMLENRFRPGVTELPSGLQYLVLQDGGGGPAPKAGEGVSLRFRVSNIEGKELLNVTADGVPKKMLMDSLMPGWRQALELMTPGAKWRLFVPPYLAFGEKGSPDGVVKPNQTAVFDMELVGMAPPEEAWQEMDKPITRKISGN